MAATIQNSLIEVNVDNISIDPFNPRGETEDQIINDPSFDKLKDSIQLHGIMTPIVIRKSNIGTDKEYTLVDGERRFRAALDLNMRSIAAMLAKDDIEGRAIAYQIHMNRKPWSRAAEAKAIKHLIEEMKEETPNITETEIKKRLKNITNHKLTAINEFLDIIKYDDSAIDRVMSGGFYQSYLTRIEQDFTIPISKTYPEIVDSFGINEIRSIMLSKAEDGLLGSTRYMMTNPEYKLIFSNLKERQFVISIITEFLNDKSKSITTLTQEYLDINCSNLENAETTQLNDLKVEGTCTTQNPEKDSSSNTNSTQTVLPGNVEFPINIDCIIVDPVVNTETPEDISGSVQVSIQKQTRIADIKPLFTQIGKTLSDEELEYIKEAIKCLESSCFKAATLMIWSSAVSRILNFINFDITKFNEVSKIMKDNPKSFYKFYSSSFRISSASIEEIRELAKDTQLLCYICYIQVISISDFKKFKSHYEMRNECAHPTSIKIKPNEIVSIFENIYTHIFRNSKLI